MKSILLFLSLILSANAWAQATLEIISPHWEGMRYEVEQGFLAQRKAENKPPVEFRWVEVGGTSDIIRFVHSEFKRSPSGIGVDLVYGGGIDPFIDMRDAGFLAQVDSNLLPGIDLNQKVAGNSLHDKERHYFSAVISSFGILCNRTVLAALKIETPKTWTDLIRPELAGWISIADPRRSGSSHLMFEIFLQAFGWEKGWEFIGKLASQTRIIVPSSPQVARDIVNGEVACGLLIDSHAIAQLSEFGTERLQYIVPTDLPVMNGDGIAILKGAPHQQLAEEFLQYVLSIAGQRRIFLRRGTPGGPQVSELSRMSMRPELYSEMSESLVTLNPFQVKDEIKYDTAKGSRRWNIVNDLARVLIVDHRPNGNERLTAPISENQVEDLITHKIWQIPETRLSEMARWGR